VILACADSESSLSEVLQALEGKGKGQTIRVRTKSDLEIQREDRNDFDVSVSSETGEGLSSLVGIIDDAISDSMGSVPVDMPILTRSRHIHGITHARSEIAAFGNSWREAQLPAPVAAVHLRSAAVALESLIGAVSTEDVLDRVFSSFCVGK
jgi:tRNA modification GTPase